MPSFYIDFHERSTETKVIGDEHHHIVNVFRHALGDVIQIVNGEGLTANGTIKCIDKKRLALKVTDIKYTKRPEKRVACAFSLLKNKNDLMIVEKLTELGVTDLFPIQTINSVKMSKESTIDKMKKTAISAVKQCNNPWLPKIHEVLKLDGLLKFLNNMEYTSIVASEMRPNMTLNAFLRENPRADICVIIGCEGGFDDSEFAMFDKNFITQVKISDNILRAETAAICAVVQIMNYEL